ncbi:hypothetical protein ACI65C_005686 [Semiaphis heraclei]
MDGTGSHRGSTATTTAVKHFQSTLRIAQPQLRRLGYQTVPAPPTPPARIDTSLPHTARRPRPSDRTSRSLRPRHQLITATPTPPHPASTVPQSRACALHDHLSPATRPTHHPVSAYDLRFRTACRRACRRRSHRCRRRSRFGLPQCTRENKIISAISIDRNSFLTCERRLVRDFGCTNAQ